MSPSCVGGQSALLYHTNLSERRKPKRKPRPKLKKYHTFADDELSSAPTPANYEPTYRADQPKKLRIKP